MYKKVATNMHILYTHKAMVHCTQTRQWYMYILLLPPLRSSPSHTHRVLEEVLQRGGDFRDEGMGSDLLAEL